MVEIPPHSILGLKALVKKTSPATSRKYYGRMVEME
jgi:hypothetical protein